MGFCVVWQTRNHSTDASLRTFQTVVAKIPIGVPSARWFFVYCVFLNVLMCIAWIVGEKYDFMNVFLFLPTSTVVLVVSLIEPGFTTLFFSLLSCIPCALFNPWFTFALALGAAFYPSVLFEVVWYRSIVKIRD